MQKIIKKDISNKKSGKRFSLAFKLIASILFLSILPLSIFGIITYLNTKATLTNKVNNDLCDLSTQTALQIDEWFSSIKVMVESFSAGAPKTTDTKSIKEYLAGIQKSSGDIFETIFITDTYGQTLAFSNKEESVNLKDRSYFRPALSGQTVVSEILVSRQSGNPIVVIATPFRVKGQIEGILGATVPLSKMTAVVNRIKVGTKGYAFLVDNNSGLVIAHPNKEKILKENLLYSNVKELTDALKKSAIGESGMTTYTYEGVTKFMAYAPIKNTAWSLGVTAPVNDEGIFGVVSKLTNQFMLIFIITLIVIVFSAYYLVKIITKPIEKITKVAKIVSTGDLRAQTDVKSSDEIGLLANVFNEMVKSLHQLASQVKDNAIALATSSEQISATVQQISAGSQEQTNQVSNISQTIEQLSASLEEVAQKAQEATRVGEETYQTAQKGEEVILRTIDGMNVINERISDLGNSSTKIGEIIKVIDDIADQTNLLALNAAIEAARAGEQGKGFAVVAEEVRKLAERSSAATKEISQIILGIQEGTKRATEAVQGGTILTNDAGNAFKMILEKVEATSQMIDEIAALAQEQAVNSNEISKNVENIVAISEETAAGVEETAASAMELNNMAQKLEEMVSSFKI